MRTLSKTAQSWSISIPIVVYSAEVPIFRLGTSFIIFMITILMNGTLRGEEFWATPLIKGKGDDYLFVVNPQETEKEPGKRIRCSQSLPLYIEEMAKTAARVDSKLLMRIEAELVPESNRIRAKELKIKMVCVAPKSSYPILSKLNSWEKFPDSLPQEKTIEPKGTGVNPFESEN